MTTKTYSNSACQTINSGVPDIVQIGRAEKLNRRGFLKGLALFSAASAPMVAAAAVAPEPHPDAELLALGADLDREMSRYHDLKGKEQEAIDRFAAIEPEIPDDLKMMSGGDLLRTDWPPDHRGACNAMRVQNRVRIPQRYSLDEAVKELDGRTSLGRYMRRLKKLSDGFHEAHQAAREEAGVGQAETARYRQGRIVVDLNGKIANISASTLAGLAVKARAELTSLVASEDEGGLKPHPRVVALFENLVALGARA